MGEKCCGNVCSLQLRLVLKWVSCFIYTHNLCNGLIIKWILCRLDVYNTFEDT